MKIFIDDSVTDKEQIKKKISSNDIEFTDDKSQSLFLLTPNNSSRLLGYKNNEIIIINPHEVSYIESFGKDIICHVSNNQFKLTLRLYEIEGQFLKYGLIRISNSFIINANMIARITPQLNRKIKLTLKDKSKLYVTRSYYYKFKEYIGM